MNLVASPLWLSRRNNPVGLLLWYPFVRMPNPALKGCLEDMKDSFLSEWIWHPNATPKTTGPPINGLFLLRGLFSFLKFNGIALFWFVSTSSVQ